uniref:Uncharacterized protein n=1 Tax=Vespula pensylvanica TaxID=30213 RepID=A0A834P462_VESPE|nr:hypothetical protein H0235_007129 [Vespula pensylvanica]
MAGLATVTTSNLGDWNKALNFRNFNFRLLELGIGSSSSNSSNSNVVVVVGVVVVVVVIVPREAVTGLAAGAVQIEFPPSSQLAKQPRRHYPFGERERCEGRSKQQVHRSETVREEKEEEKKEENKVNEEEEVKEEEVKEEEVKEEEVEEEEETNDEIVLPITLYNYNDEDC